MSYTSFIYQQPTRIVFGKNSIGKLGGLVSAIGAKKVFLVTGGDSVRKTGVLEQIIKQLETSGIGYYLYQG